ncbi:MAG: helix-turn-helix domain-containing protein [Alkaliphilus sp.]
MEIKLLLVAEVAEILRVPISRVYDLARQNMLPHVRVGRQIRFDAEALQNYILTGGKAFPDGWKKEANIQPIRKIY